MNRVQKPRDQHVGTVLVVDDDVESVLLTRRVVESVCPTLCMKDLRGGEELISYLQGEHGFSDRLEFPYPTLILLDLSMAGMRGFEVLAWLTTHPPHDRIPVAVLTSSGDVKLAQQSYALGARTFLTKPLMASEFKETIETVFKCDRWSGYGIPAGDRPPEL